LRKVEQHLFLQLNLPEANVLCSLDEPLFQLFDGPKLIDMMKRMGMTENEEIEHSMVSRSIQRAQEKIAEKISTNRRAASQNEWFELNKATQSNAYKR
jgi:preprotein translocase subunit SecA